jgi:ketosteroid isomerase-like protein
MTTSSADVVRRFFESMQARDWEAAAACLAPDIEVWWPASGERFVGRDFLAVQRAYPEGWQITVASVLASGEQVAARVQVDLAPDRFWCAGFYTVRDGVITDGVEHWVTEGADEIPAWRRPFNA